MKRLLQFLEIEPGELTLDALDSGTVCGFMLMIAGFIFLLGFLKVPV